MTAVKHATAGVWDRDDWPCYFLAIGFDGVGLGADSHPFALLAVNEMLGAGAYERASAKIDEWVAAGVRVLLDSGIFWLTNQHKRAHGVTMDQALALHPNQIDNFDVLFDRYVDVCKRFGDRVWGYIELDQGGKDRKRETRRRLEQDYGLRPIPVAHPLNDGREYVEELMATYDRVCFGNVVQADVATRARLLHLMWEVRAKNPDTWIHVLGITPSEMMLAFPTQSCDSSSWLSHVRWHDVALGERAMLKVVAKYPHNHAYILGDRSTWDEAIRQSAFGFGAMQQSWRDVLDERRELGFEPYDVGVSS